MIWTLVLLMIILVVATTIALAWVLCDGCYDAFVCSLIFFMSSLIYSIVFAVIVESNVYQLRAIQHYRDRIQAIELRIEKEPDELEREYLERVKIPQLQKCYDSWYDRLYGKKEEEKENAENP
jgi:hypothetical protein